MQLFKKVAKVRKKFLVYLNKTARPTDNLIKAGGNKQPTFLSV